MQFGSDWVNRVQQDATKPIGEACNADGTLKEAREINWLDSPSDETPPSLPFSKRVRSEDLDPKFADPDQVNPKRPRVSKFQVVDK